MSDSVALNAKRPVLSTRNLFIIIATIAIYFIIVALPRPAALSLPGIKSIALMIGALIFWVLDVLPVGVTALLFTVLQPIVGTVNPGAMAANFMPSTFFFTVACFLISQALLETGLGNRLVLGLIKITNRKPKRLLFLLMCGTSLISFVIANLALAALMVPLLLQIFKDNDLQPLKSNYAKACLIGIPIAISIGGLATPAGALPNYQAIALLQSVSGITVSFGQWFAYGAPLAIILTPISYWIVVRVFKPEITELAEINIEQRLKELGKFSFKEIAFLVIFAALIASWFLTSIPMPISGMLACCLFFLPKIEVLSFKSFSKAINWDVLMLICGSTGLAMAIFQTGAAKWIATSVLSPFTGMNPAVMIAVIIFFAIVMHLLIPVNPSMVAVFVPIVALFAPTMGLHAVSLVLPLAYAVNAAILLPLDPVFVVTYAPGYYTMRDLPKAGIPLAVIWTIVGTLVMVVGGIF